MLFVEDNSLVYKFWTGLIYFKTFANQMKTIYQKVDVQKRYLWKIIPSYTHLGLI